MLGKNATTEMTAFLLSKVLKIMNSVFSINIKTRIYW